LGTNSAFFTERRLTGLAKMAAVAEYVTGRSRRDRKVAVAVGGICMGTYDFSCSAYGIAPSPTYADGYDRDYTLW